MYIHSPKITPSDFFFKDFALYVLRFRNILRIFILRNTYQLHDLGECLLVEATLKSHREKNKLPSLSEQ